MAFEEMGCIDVVVDAAYASIRAALVGRLAAVDAQKDIALSTELDD